jgi:peptide deformylase
MSTRAERRVCPDVHHVHVDRLGAPAGDRRAKIRCMAILQIRTFGDPVLRERAREVDKITRVHRRLVKDMIQTMRDAPGVGLAAPQVGVLERVFVYEVEDEVGAIFNPVLVEVSEEKETDDEGCLSLPTLVYPVERSSKVKIEGLDERGRPVSMETGELLARVFQHELDHLNGILFVDRLPDDIKRVALRELTGQTLGLAGVASPGPEREETL